MQHSKKHTRNLVAQIKQQDCDFEFYPTTEKQLSVIKSDIQNLASKRRVSENPAILDCGAGDGRALMYLTEGKRYAIEKAQPLIHAMDRSIFVVGAEFEEQTLLDKGAVECVFSNPPYKEFANWASKIIRETRAGYVYLIIPCRWKSSPAIQEAITLREAKAEVLASDDFYDADRAARAVVDIIRVDLTHKYTEVRYGSRAAAMTDPFAIWFKSNFKLGTDPERVDKADNSHSTQSRLKRELVAGNDLVSALTQMYEQDMDKLIANYRAVDSLDFGLLRELGVSGKDLKEGLRLKISALKDRYWRELFNNLSAVTSRLTQKSRTAMLDTLMDRTDVDFNAKNAYAVLTWIVKGANFYFDDQLIHLVEKITQAANIQLYTSNQRTFGAEDWRYTRRPADLSHYYLDYRFILQSCGGIWASQWEHERTKFNGLTEYAYHTLKDFLTVAHNLGFESLDRDPITQRTWESGTKQLFKYKNRKTGKIETLLEVRAFLNGNMHFRVKPELMMAMNVEFGRLKGWVKNHQQASTEMGISEEVAGQYFASNLLFTHTDVLQLTHLEAA